MGKLAPKYKVYKEKGIWKAMTISVKPFQKHLSGSGDSPVAALNNLIAKEAVADQEIDEAFSIASTHL